MPTKCKFCTDGLEYEWTQVGKPPKWKLCNGITGAPHQCKRDAPQEISSNTQPKKEWKPRETGHSKLWKLDYTSETKSYRICGDCNDGTQTTTVTDCLCKVNPCPNFCPKCDKHPRLMLVTNDPKNRL